MIGRPGERDGGEKRVEKWEIRRRRRMRRGLDWGDGREEKEQQMGTKVERWLGER